MKIKQSMCEKLVKTTSSACPPLNKMVIALLGLSIPCLISTPSLAAYTLTQKTNLPILLLSADDSEPTTAAWESTFKQVGVPYKKVVLTSFHSTHGQTLNHGFFGDYTYTNPTTTTCATANFSGVVIARGGLIYANSNGGYSSALSPDEWTELNNYKKACGIRQVTAYTYPNSDYGLNTPVASGDISLLPQQANTYTANLTATGLTVFPYLKGPISFKESAWGYYSIPISTTNFTTLMTGPNGSSLLGIYKHDDGREEMVSTFDQGPNQFHTLLLRHGMLSWLTYGTFLGYSRNYLEVHIDDIFGSDDRWDVVTNTTLFDDAHAIRMRPVDVTNAIAWQTKNGFTFDFLFNAGEASSTDALTQTLLRYRNQFYWISHTFSHLNLDNKLDPATPVTLASVSDIRDEVKKNTDFALKYGLRGFWKGELVTGEHSGLYNNYLAPVGMGLNWPGNYHLGQALEAEGVIWTGSNSSVSPLPYNLPCTSATENAAPYSNSFTYLPAPGPVTINGTVIQPAKFLIDTDSSAFPIPLPFQTKCAMPLKMYANPVVAVPRFPTNIYYNASTQNEQLSEYNYIYRPVENGGGCVDNVATTCRSQDASWGEYVNETAKQILYHILTNHPEPHYIHQSNLVGSATDPTWKGVAYPVLDNVIANYRPYFSTNSPLLHLYLETIGIMLNQKIAWDNGLFANALTGYILNGQVVLTNTSTKALKVPVTGTTYGSSYGGQLSGWVTINPGVTVTLPAKPTTP